ncbi:MAG: hypothetical protein PHX08_13870 [Lachnospiraceae bacterium]|nr:hypothetical protein [Lachnospiraceae bacterium]
MNKQEIEIIKFQQEGYKPLVDFNTWRVAVLKYCEDLKIENINTMQKHSETDEVFVLLQGRATLFSGGSEDVPKEILAVTMEQHKIYNVKKGVWHNHILSEEGEILIVENRNTTDDNSPIIKLTTKQRKEIIDLKEA